MARASKATNKTEESASIVQTPVVDKAAAPKVVKATKPKKEAAVAVTTAPVSASTQPVVQEATADVVVVDSSLEVDALNKKSEEFISKIQQVSVLLSSLKSEFRLLQKQWSRDMKVAQKASSKRKRKSGTRSPSGFVKPTRISDELASFLEKPTGTEMARTDVTREINTYIRSNNLQDKQNGRKINPDAKLAKLLKVSKTDELTYFNLQKYMSPHFAKNVKVEGVAVVAASV